jgi:hypothetical protein
MQIPPRRPKSTGCNGLLHKKILPFASLMHVDALHRALLQGVLSFRLASEARRRQIIKNTDASPTPLAPAPGRRGRRSCGTSTRYSRMRCVATERWWIAGRRWPFELKW